MHLHWSEPSLIACAFYSLRAIWRGINENPLPYWVDVQADLRLCWLHRSCRFCRALAHLHHHTIFTSIVPDVLGLFFQPKSIDISPQKYIMWYLLEVPDWGSIKYSKKDLLKFFRKHFPKFSLFASWPGTLINPQWLQLPMSWTIFYRPKCVRAIEVRLQILKFEQVHLTIIAVSRMFWRNIKLWRSWSKLLRSAWARFHNAFDNMTALPGVTS